MSDRSSYDDIKTQSFSEGIPNRAVSRLTVGALQVSTEYELLGYEVFPRILIPIIPVNFGVLVGVFTPEALSMILMVPWACVVVIAAGVVTITIGKLVDVN